MAVAKHGVSSNTPDRLLIGPGAVYIDFYDVDSPGTLLGATKGGSVLELNRTIRDIRPDGAKGKVKGFRRVEGVDATLKVNMLEFTAENLRRALAVDSYSSGTTDATDEAVGSGNGILTEFALDHGKVLENSETVTVNAASVVRGTDYTVDYDTGVLQFFTAVTDTHAIVASYTYVSGDAVIIGEEVPDDAYCDNVVLVGTVTGYDGTTKPIIIKLTNVLCDAGLNLNLANNEEVVSEVTFSAHYSNADLATEPWQITYPS
jgi:hypothetical protein